MIELIVSNDILIKDLTDEHKKTIESNLTLINPAWDTASRMGLSIWGVPQKLKYYSYDEDGMRVPVGLLQTLQDYFGQNCKIVDNRFLTTRKIPIKFQGELRDYQEDAVKSLLQSTNGVLCAQTGSGKTHVLLKLICELQQPTLVLVHTIELANQFIERISQFTNLTKKSIGMLGQGKKDLQPITVGLLQTVVSTSPEELNSKFSVVIVDEVHICPAQTYAEAMSKLSAKYKYGASATPERADGLTKVIFWLTGPILHTIPSDKLTDVILKPTIRQVETNYSFPLFNSSEFQSMITDMAMNEDRNKLILETLKDYPTQQVILLCARKEQILFLKTKIPDSVILTSDMSKKERKEVMAGLISGKHRIVISTYALFSTGIDVASLEVAFFCSPIKSKVLVRQSAGRLMRICEKINNKKPIIVDFVDKKIDILKHHWYVRNRILRNL